MTIREAEEKLWASVSPSAHGVAPSSCSLTTRSPNQGPTYLLLPGSVVGDESQGDVVEEIEEEGQEEHVLGKLLPLDAQQRVQGLQGQHLMPVLGVHHHHSHHGDQGRGTIVKGGSETALPSSGQSLPPMGWFSREWQESTF